MSSVDIIFQRLTFIKFYSPLLSNNCYIIKNITHNTNKSYKRLLQDGEESERTDVKTRTT